MANVRGGLDDATTQARDQRGERFDANHLTGIKFVASRCRTFGAINAANYRCQRKGHNDGQVIERAGHLLNPFESENLQPSGWQQGRFWIEIHGMDMGKEMSIQPRVAGLHQIKQQASNEQGP